MKWPVVFCCTLLLLSCSRSVTGGEQGGVHLVPSRDRVFIRSDSEPVVTTWRPVGLSWQSAGKAILYGLLIADAPLLDAEKRPAGTTLKQGTRVTVTEATGWQEAGGEYKRWYRVRPSSAAEGWVDSSSVALITQESGALRAGFLERRINISGGESEYNLLVLGDGSSLSLLDTSALVFADSFHPSGVTGLSIQDVNADGVPEVVVDAETIVSLQFLGASPLSWEAWMREKAGSWAPIFRYNVAYGTDQGNSYNATRRVFSSTGTGLRDTVKVTTDVVEAVPQGEFHNTEVSFYLWNGSVYKEDPARALPQEGTISAALAELRAGPGPESAVVEKLKTGDTLYVFDRADQSQVLNGQKGFWLHATSHSGKDGWIHSSEVSLSKIDPLKVNRDVFLGKSGISPASGP